MLKRPPRLLVPAALTAAVAVAAVNTLLAGCSPSQVSGCADVSLAVRDTRIERVTDDLHLTARLTSNGRPVAGRRPAPPSA
ncbi:hypothetical protein AB0E27_12335 [Streptomyces sparsogenes]|uniref:hypothetical protein n=1 Tax=Streptomyces sparsogenes TaxID=67365 RepID=UPI0033F7A24C